MQLFDLLYLISLCTEGSVHYSFILRDNTVKITAEKETGRILGAVMMCERATDLIQELAAAVAEGMTVKEALQIIHGHPTFAEVIVSALEALEKKL